MRICFQMVMTELFLGKAIHKKLMFSAAVELKLLFFLCFTAVYGLGLINAHAVGPEYILDESRAPNSTDAITSPMKKEFETKEKKASDFPSLKERLENLDPFSSDTSLDLKIRSYYFLKDLDNPDEKNEAWALGGWLDYESGTVSSPDQDELDLTVDFRFKKGLLNGFWLRLRGAYLDQKGPEARDVTNIRVILNYDISIL